MPWSIALANIVTEAVLTEKLGPYALAGPTNTAIAGKLNAQNGIANNLHLTGFDENQPDSAVPYSKVFEISNELHEKLNDKASLTGLHGNAVFTINITAPAATAPTHVVIKSQLNDYLPLSGGTVTNPISFVDTNAIVLDSHLTNVKYVKDAISAAVSPTTTTTQTSVTTQSLNDYSDKIATTKFVTDKVEEVLGGNDLILGTATAATPQANDDSDRIATTEWVREYIAQVLESST